MKKVLMIVFLVACMCLVGCGSSGEELASRDTKIKVLEEEKEELENQINDLQEQVSKKNDRIIELENEISAAQVEKETKKEAQENKVYGLNETWTVDGMWNLTFTSVSITDERNKFHDTNPAQVVIINYTYENLGYVGKSQDLFISTMDMSYIDESGKMAETYPVSGDSRAQPTPIGAICDASEAVGLKNASSSIKITVSKRDSNGEEQKATFELPVQ